MFTFFATMWDWLPFPLGVLFYALFMFLVLYCLVSIVITIIDLIPFI